MRSEPPEGTRSWSLKQVLGWTAVGMLGLLIVAPLLTRDDDPAPVATPPRATSTPSPTTVFLMWYRANGYPASAYNDSLATVRSACRSLRAGASGAEVASAIAIGAAPDVQADIAYVVGAGVQAICPDQSHKFR